MRFLLKPRRSRAANSPHLPASSFKKVAAARAPVQAATENARGTGRAWGQRCSPDCGCIVRVEARLSEGPSAASPTIAEASYHAKRIMGTSRATDGGGRRWRPLATQHSSHASRPILVPCACPTLHCLARRAVDHMAGKTLAQMRNEVDTGLAGSRSPVSRRHTVLRETVLPHLRAEAGGDSALAGAVAPAKCEARGNDDDGVGEMNSTRRYGHCYDLVEDALLSLFLGRAPAPRRDSEAESYSPTVGGRFRMYSPSGRDGLSDDDEDEPIPSHDAGDRRRRSPASRVLFGDEGETTRTGAVGADAESATGILFRHLRELKFGRAAGGRGMLSDQPQDLGEDRRPTTTYLQLLDMYGGEHAGGKEAENAADWLEYVDQTHHQA